MVDGWIQHQIMVSPNLREIEEIDQWLLIEIQYQIETTIICDSGGGISTFTRLKERFIIWREETEK